MNALKPRPPIFRRAPEVIHRPGRQTPSPKQELILAFLRRYMRENQCVPTIREIQSGTGISSTSVVDYNLDHLQRLGLIERGQERSRQIVVKEPDGCCVYCGRGPA